MAKNNSESMGIDLVGRVNSLKLAEKNMLLPLFEAIVNSIHAIEEAKTTNGNIEIIIGRETALSFDDTDINIPGVNQFTIIDNGIGFDENNYESFKKAFSTHKAEIGGKGIGRFLWLKAFSDVRIESIYNQDGLVFKRNFKFNLINMNGIELTSNVEIQNNQEKLTKVALIGYKDPFKSKCPKRADTIANRIIEHCLIYFLKENCPSILLSDGATQINLNNKFNELISGNIFTEKFKVKDFEFTINLLKWFEHDELTYNRMSFCANSREVENFNINKVFQDLTGKVQDEATGKFYLIVGYLESEYLDKNVNEQRTEIEFCKEGLFDKELLSEQEIYSSLEPVIRLHFETVVKNFREKKFQIINTFISDKAPQYRILSKNAETLDKIVVTDNMSDQDIDLKLYKAYQDIEFDSRKEVNIILNSITDEATPDELKEKYFNVLHTLTEINKTKLAQYVVHRQYIIELFEKSLGLNTSGKYEIEKTVHDIVFPTKKNSDEIDYNEQNLWLIDERLSFHTFLSSDKPLNSVDGLETDSIDRPDLLIFNNPFSFAEDDEAPFNSIILLEFKRPMRDNYNPETDNPIEQIYDYVEKIRKGKQLLRNGRPYPINDNTWFYTYLICDLNDKIEKWATYAQLDKTYDGLGYYGYNKKLKCLIEVLTFDQIISNAKKRNKVLFHKLGI